MTELTHVDAEGKASMVDISDKTVTSREARATATICMSPESFAQVIANTHKKGDVLQVARIAGIQAAKKCADLIPLCHPLMLSKVQVEFAEDSDNNRIQVIATCKLAGKTGVEMEALTAASVAALTVFDMCKAVDPAMTITDVTVLHKSGGKRGNWSRALAGQADD